MSKVKVMVGMSATIRTYNEVTMERSEYERWSEKIHSAEGLLIDMVTDELCEYAYIDWDDGRIEDIEIDDFHVLY